MSFMKPEIFRDKFQVIRDTSEGDIYTPLDFADSPEDAANEWDVPIENIETIEGYGARLSASGYMDCTEWAVFDTREEAAQYLLDMYGNECGEPEDWEAELEEIAKG